MRSVLLSWSSGVTDDEAADVEAGIRQVLRIIEKDEALDILGRGWDADRWTEPDSTAGIGHGPQVFAEDIYFRTLDSLIKRELESKLSFAALAGLFVVVAVTDVDLKPSNGSWLYGATKLDPVPISMLSVARLRRIDRSLKRSALRRLARHEFAHAIGLVPDERREDVTVEDGNFGRHCRNRCTMRQTDVAGAPTLEAAVADEESQEIQFCAQCIADLRSTSRP